MLRFPTGKFDFLQKSLCMNIECATNYTCICLDCLGWLSLILSSSGKTAALGILGRDEPIRSVPFFWTVQYKKSIRYTGTSMICVPVSFLWVTIHRLNLQIKCSSNCKFTQVAGDVHVFTNLNIETCEWSDASTCTKQMCLMSCTVHCFCFDRLWSWLRWYCCTWWSGCSQIHCLLHKVKF